MRDLRAQLRDATAALETKHEQLRLVELESDARVQAVQARLEEAETMHKLHLDQLSALDNAKTSLTEQGERAERRAVQLNKAAVEQEVERRTAMYRAELAEQSERAASRERALEDEARLRAATAAERERQLRDELRDIAQLQADIERQHRIETEDRDAQLRSLSQQLASARGHIAEDAAAAGPGAGGRVGWGSGAGELVQLSAALQASEARCEELCKERDRLLRQHERQEQKLLGGQTSSPAALVAASSVGTLSPKTDTPRVPPNEQQQELSALLDQEMDRTATLTLQLQAAREQITEHEAMQEELRGRLRDSEAKLMLLENRYLEGEERAHQSKRDRRALRAEALRAAEQVQAHQQALEALHEARKQDAARFQEHLSDLAGKLQQANQAGIAAHRPRQRTSHQTARVR